MDFKRRSMTTELTNELGDQHQMKLPMKKKSEPVNMKVKQGNKTIESVFKGPVFNKD